MPIVVIMLIVVVIIIIITTTTTINVKFRLRVNFVVRVSTEQNRKWKQMQAGAPRPNKTTQL